MLISNESNWNTEYLEELVRCIEEMEGFKKGSHVYSSTLLLFRTYAPKKYKNYLGEESVPDAAAYRKYSKRWNNTIEVMIRSRTQLSMDVLDRMAHIGENYEQDMPSNDVQCVAKHIANALGKWGAGKLDYSWAKTKSLRSRSKIKRSSVAAIREIYKLKTTIEDIEIRADLKIEKLRNRISKINKLHGF